MAANGYGYGNLPMDIYKMVYHNNWDHNGRADGQGDYTAWGVYKVKIIYWANTSDGRDIKDGDAYVKAFDGDYVCDSTCGDTVYYTDGGFYWVVDGDGNLDADFICNTQGGNDWAYYE